MSLKPDKSSIRSDFRKKRSLLSKAEVENESRAINQNFITNLLPQIYKQNLDKIFSIYLSSGNEVNTDNIIEHFKKNHIAFSYPKIIAKDQPLKFILDEENQDFVACNIYSTIFEPNCGKEVIPDILILPLIAFDHDLNRLGAGGGFFDRTISSLKKHHKKIITIGLAYDFQRLGEALPIENTDQKLDFIVTKNKIFSASQ